MFLISLSRLQQGIDAALLLCLCMFLQVVAASETLFVAASGKDIPGCGSTEANACRQVHFAVSQAVEHTEIRVGAGLFDCGVAINSTLLAVVGQRGAIMDCKHKQPAFLIFDTSAVLSGPLRALPGSKLFCRLVDPQRARRWCAC